MDSLNDNHGVVGYMHEERKNSMSFNYFMLNKDFIILGSDSRESYQNDTYDDNRQKTFVNKDLKLCWSFTGLTKIDGIDCIDIINIILNSKSDIIIKLQFIENILCYQTLQYFNKYQKDSIFDLFVAENSNNKINVYVLEVKNGISITKKNRVYYQGEITPNLASGVHTDMIKDINYRNMQDKLKAPKELDRLIHLVMNESEKTDKTVGGDIYVVAMDNNGNIKTYINGVEKAF